MPRQVTDEEYNFLQQRRMTADFVESIYNDPALNKEAKRLIKKKYPQLAIPDLDIEDRVQAQIDADRKQRKDADDAVAKKKADDEWKAERSRVQKEFGFTDDGMKDLEGWMTDKGVGDYEVAAGYRASKNPRASEPTYDPGLWQNENVRKPEFKEVVADPEAWAKREILSAIHRDQERTRGR
jgi:hypothetical protein